MDRGDGGICLVWPGGWLCGLGRKIGALGLKLGRGGRGGTLRCVSDKFRWGVLLGIHTFLSCRALNYWTIHQTSRYCVL